MLFRSLDIGGVTGSRSVANLNTASGSDEPKWITQNLTLLFDHGTGQIYVLSMYCSGSCYLANRQAIDEVAALTERHPHDRRSDPPLLLRDW